MSTLKALRKKRPGNREKIESIKEGLLREQDAFQLRELREGLGITQANLAEKIGVKQHRISQIENGVLLTVQLSTLQSYLNALGVELELTIKSANGDRSTLVLSD
ncbi:helix-turn-helix domain-containing protein [Corynebacterium sp. L4756]|uniref:helix-turn-helix domain-containing protein n=1 Tax=unclassified Corynebacterium TaxID=2624378 RepID=UPI00374D5E91